MLVVKLEPYGRGGIGIEFSLPVTSHASEVDELLVSSLSFMMGIAPDAVSGELSLDLRLMCPAFGESPVSQTPLRATPRWTVCPLAEGPNNRSVRG